MAKTMLINPEHIEESEKLREEAVNRANYLLDRMFTTARNEIWKTRYEVKMEKRPNLHHTRTLGCTVQEHIPRFKGQINFQARAKVDILVGLVHGNSYKIYFPNGNKFMNSREVKFNEGQLG